MNQFTGSTSNIKIFMQINFENTSQKIINPVNEHNFFFKATSLIKRDEFFSLFNDHLQTFKYRKLNSNLKFEISLILHLQNVHWRAGRQIPKFIYQEIKFPKLQFILHIVSLIGAHTFANKMATKWQQNGEYIISFIRISLRPLKR